jgi:hypothetical protein
MILNHADKRKMGDDNPKKVRSVAIRGTYIGTKTRFEKRRWQNSSQSVDIPPISTPAKKIEDYKINNHDNELPAADSNRISGSIYFSLENARNFPSIIIL